MGIKKRSVVKYKPKGRKIVNSTKTEIDGIVFDSKLEGYMYTLLRDEEIPFEVQKTYLLVSGFKYPAGCYERKSSKDMTLVDKSTIRKMEYTPDFVHPNEEFIIEVKGRANESFPLRWKFFQSTMSQRDLVPILFKPSTQTECREVVTILKSKGYGSNK